MIEEKTENRKKLEQCQSEINTEFETLYIRKIQNA